MRICELMLPSLNPNIRNMIAKPLLPLCAVSPSYRLIARRCVLNLSVWLRMLGLSDGLSDINLVFTSYTLICCEVPYRAYIGIFRAHQYMILLGLSNLTVFPAIWENTIPCSSGSSNTRAYVIRPMSHPRFHVWLRIEKYAHSLGYNFLWRGPSLQNLYNLNSDINGLICWT